jgi:O-antigen/teichoic acid export membrane protein
MAYTRFAAEEYSITRKMPNDIFVFSLLLCLLVFIMLSPLVLIFGKEISTLMFKSTSYSTPIILGFMAAVGLILANMISRYYQVQERYKRGGLIISLQKILFLLLLLVVVAMGQADFLSIAIVQIVIVSISGALLVLVALRHGPLGRSVTLRLSRFARFLKTSFWLILYFLCLALFSHLDVFMISRLMTKDDLADYGVAFKYYSCLMLMYPAIKTVLKVRTSKIDMVQSLERQRAFFRRWMRTTTVFFVPAVVLVISLSGHVMNSLNGVQYAASVSPFKILALSATCSYIFSPNTDIFRAMKRYFLLFCFGFAALVLNLCGNCWLIPRYGISGAAVATLLSGLLVNGLATIYVMTKR